MSEYGPPAFNPVTTVLFNALLGIVTKAMGMPRNNRRQAHVVAVLVGQANSLSHGMSDGSGQVMIASSTLWLLHSTILLAGRNLGLSLDP